MKIAIANDHTAIEMKKAVVAHLEKQNITCIDLGCFDEQSVDYPDYAEKVAYAVANNEVTYGILICGTGIGMSIAANRFPEVRAALCYEVTTTKFARSHNNANILVTGARLIANYKFNLMIDAFLNTDFLGERHATRVNKLGKLNCSHNK